MSNTRTSLEVIAPTVEEAIENGLSDLGLPPQAVDIEILDEGTRGLFGIRSRQARVRLTILPQAPKEPDIVGDMEIPVTEMSLEQEFDEVVKEKLPAQPTDMDDILLETARLTTEDLLEKMGIKVEVTASFAEETDNRGRLPVIVDILGKDLSILIGRKSETLNALQYIVTLIVSKEMGHAVSIIVDVEGYRQRREQQLRQLARRMAEQAIKTGRRQTLEPMPPNERRIVHIELRQDPEVSTESIGEDPHRKVTIIPQ